MLLISPGCPWLLFRARRFANRFETALRPQAEEQLRIAVGMFQSCVIHAFVGMRSIWRELMIGTILGLAPVNAFGVDFHYLGVGFHLGAFVVAPGGKSAGGNPELGANFQPLQTFADHR